jgi:para-aminobenzoate synthetase component I
MQPANASQSPFFMQPMAWQEPASAFAAVASDSGAVLLDSAVVDEARGRWSIIACQPQRMLTGNVDSGLFLDGVDYGQDLARAMRDLMGDQVPDSHCMPVPGVLGYLGYEAGQLCDVMPAPVAERLLPDVWLGFYDTLAVFDHAEQKAWITSLVPDGPARLAEVLESPVPHYERQLYGFWKEDGHASDYPAMVEAIVERIAAGDVFQVNATWCFDGEKPDGLDAFILYHRLKALSPAPFSAFMRLGEGKAVVSASPELFLRVSAAGEVETRPIKGTRPRGKDRLEDAMLAKELAHSPKDRAENLMIVDLMRNDLGRVCETGSVQAPLLWDIEHFHNVHHLVSEVQGRLKEGYDAVDLLCACLPPGSVTGAPKIECLTIIRELEKHPRGAYCGTALHWGCGGTLSSSVLIRTMSVVGNRVTAQAGGGIVFDSNPQEELAEMLVKARAMRQALAGSV